jgi:hypothetical protein
MTNTEAGLIMAAIYAAGVILLGLAIAIAIGFSPLPAMLEAPPEPPKQNPAWIGFDKIDRH